MSAVKRYCVFCLANHRLAIDVTRIQEVLQDQPLTRVPLADPVIIGLMNLRGKIVPVMDVHRRLRLQETDRQDGRLHVVVATHRGFLSLMVEEVSGVLDVPDEDIEELPDTVGLEFRALVQGMIRNDGGLVLVLDMEAFVALESVVPEAVNAEP